MLASNQASKQATERKDKKGSEDQHDDEMKESEEARHVVKVKMLATRSAVWGYPKYITEHPHLFTQSQSSQPPISATARPASILSSKRGGHQPAPSRPRSLRVHTRPHTHTLQLAGRTTWYPTSSIIARADFLETKGKPPSRLWRGVQLEKVHLLAFQRRIERVVVRGRGGLKIDVVEVGAKLHQ